MRLVEPAIIRPGVTELPVQQCTSRGEVRPAGAGGLLQDSGEPLEAFIEDGHRILGGLAQQQAGLLRLPAGTFHDGAHLCVAPGRELVEVHDVGQRAPMGGCPQGSGVFGFGRQVTPAQLLV